MIEVSDLRKAFGGRQILRGVSFEVGTGEVLGLVGPSGAGKSTTLNIIAGLQEPDAGEINVDGAVVTRRNGGERISLPPAMRGLGYVMQDAALFPNMTVRENIAFGPESRGLPQSETGRRVEELLRMVGVGEVAYSYPPQLSGGQHKRVALARTLALKPKILLLDEPLTSLNPELKQQLMSDLRTIFDVLDATVIYVTHDLEEAGLLADRVVRLEGGSLNN